MIKELFAAAWFLAILAALLLGLSGSLDHAVMVTFSLAALVLFYSLAAWTVISNKPGSQPLGLHDNGS